MEITELQTQREYIKTLRRIIKIMNAAPDTLEFKELETLLILLNKYECRYSQISVPEAVV